MYKVLLILLTFILVSAPSRADNAAMQDIPLLRYLAQNVALREFGITQLILARCNRYLPYPQNMDCRNSVKIMIKELNFDLIPTSNTSYVFCAFHQKLKIFLGQKDTTTFLKSVRQNINKFLTGEASSFSLWEFSTQYFKSEKLAAEYIAILFQDISLQKLHLSYLNLIQFQGSRIYELNKDELSSTIDEIRFLIDHYPEAAQEVLYPKSVQANLNPSLYHFYLPMYLALKLQSISLPNAGSYMAPLFLSLTYEFVTASTDLRYLLSDPKYLDHRDNEWKIKDIYAAHVGTAYVTKRKIISLENVQRAFKLSTQQAVSLLLRTSTTHPAVENYRELCPAYSSSQSQPQFCLSLFPTTGRYNE